MTQGLSDQLFIRLSEFIAEQLGLHFPRDRWRDLERGIGSAAREFGFKDVEAYIQWLLSSPLAKKQVEMLASHLTVGETYFFREKRSFEVLQERILSDLIHARQDGERRLRIWSAGCSTGEEPYSIAILLRRMIPDLGDWNITILATDINPHFLQKASEGVYREWSFRDTPPWIQERYFKRTKEGRFEIHPDIRKMVSFSYHNLAEDSYPSLLNNTNAMDIILCRNVLIYFAPDRAKKVIQNLYHSLVDGGWLIVSLSETSSVLFSQFVPVNFPEAVFYRKVLSLELPISNFGVQVLSSNSKLETLGSKLHIAGPTFESVRPQFDKVKIIMELKKAEPQRTLYQEAFALYRQGRYTEAEEKITMLLSQNQDTTKAMTLLAQVYANQGKLAEALEWCEKAIASDKLDAELHYLRATVLQEQGAIDEAIMSLKRVLYLAPNFVLAHFALGNLTLQIGKFRESKKHLENAQMLLRGYIQEDMLAEDEGLTAGRLMEIIRLMS